MLEVMLTEVDGQCPYCGSAVNIAIDTTGGDQNYYEDCHTCCAAIHVRVYTDMEGELLNVDLSREDDV